MNIFRVFALDFAVQKIEKYFSKDYKEDYVNLIETCQKWEQTYDFSNLQIGDTVDIWC